MILSSSFHPSLVPVAYTGISSKKRSERVRFGISHFYLQWIPWQNTVWTFSPAPHMLCFCQHGMAEREQVNFLREKCSEGQGPARPTRLSAARTLTWAPALCIWMEITSPWLSEPRKELSHGWKVWGHFSITFVIHLRNTNEAPFSTLFIFYKINSSGQWWEKLNQGGEWAILFSSASPAFWYPWWLFFYVLSVQ